jgi:hypothetical protein
MALKLKPHAESRLPRMAYTDALVAKWTTGRILTPVNSYPAASLKRYKCGHCGKIFYIETNHWGVIYRGCTPHINPKCSSECVEAEMFMLDMAKSSVPPT